MEVTKQLGVMFRDSLATVLDLAAVSAEIAQPGRAPFVTFALDFLAAFANVLSTGRRRRPLQPGSRESLRVLALLFD